MLLGVLVVHKKKQWQKYNSELLSENELLHDRLESMDETVAQLTTQIAHPESVQSYGNSAVQSPTTEDFENEGDEYEEAEALRRMEAEYGRSTFNQSATYREAFNRGVHHAAAISPPLGKASSSRHGSGEQVSEIQPLHPPCNPDEVSNVVERAPFGTEFTLQKRKEETAELERQLMELCIYKDQVCGCLLREKKKARN